MVLNEKIETLSLVELLKSLRTVSHDWGTKTPYQKLCYLYSFGDAAFLVPGLPLYRDDRKLYWYSYVPPACIFLHVSLGAYTSYFYISHGEFVKCLPSTCFLIGPVVAVRIETLPYEKSEIK